jgi:hypothetical protein
MGINIKRKFFGIDKFENYVRISKLNLIVTNPLCQEKEAYYNIEFKLSLNSDSREIEKISSQIINKSVNIKANNSSEQSQLDKFLSGYIDDETGFGSIGSIIITNPIWKILIEKNIHPLFKGYTSDQIFSFFYQLFTDEYRGYLGVESSTDMTTNQEDDQTFKNKMIPKINDVLKQKVADNNSQGVKIK